ncbi:F0F1 ATP synthase subunit delta [Vibrio sp. PP-XX7]
MAKVAEEMKAERARLLASVRQESDALRRKLALVLKNEQLSLQDTLTQRARDEVFLIARKALSDLASTSLEASMADVFVQRLAQLNDEQKANLQAAFKDVDQPFIVHTAFDLPEAQRVRIKTAFKERFNELPDIQFVTDPMVISGIEITANGQKIAWSIADYLAALTKRVSQVLQSHDKAQDSDSPEADVQRSGEPYKEQGGHERHV